MKAFYNAIVEPVLYGGRRMKMSENKQEKYLRISKELVENVGGLDNIQGVAHCATRLRIVLNDNALANIEKLEEIDLVKGVFIAGDQLQLIFGAGLVNDVYNVFSQYTHTENMSLGDIKQQSAKKQNPLQAIIKSLSDVFIDIMPGILAAALLMGITGVLSKWDVVANNETLYAINKLASLASNGIFAILPMAVCYSATKRYGGKPILGMIVGAIMLDASLANAYSVGSGSATAEVIRILGLPIELVGFQGGMQERVNTNRGLYKLTDNFFRFWYAFVFNHYSDLEMGDVDGIYEYVVAPQLHKFASFTFKEVCRQFVRRLQKENKLPFWFSKMGRWTGKTTIRDKTNDSGCRIGETEIDILALSQDKKKLLVGECKFKNTSFRYLEYLDVLAKLTPLKETAEFYYTLFSQSGFDDQLQAQARLDDHLCLYDLADIILGDKL